MLKWMCDRAYVYIDYLKEINKLLELHYNVAATKSTNIYMKEYLTTYF